MPSRMAELIQFLQAAFARKIQAEAVRDLKAKHRRRVADKATGQQAAQDFELLHPPIADRGSSIKKIQRADHIKRGLRPLRFDVPTKRERTIMRKEKLRAQQK
jgi:hypothetical protein